MDTKRLQILWDHLAIQQVLARYCRAIDRCDKELLKSVYWPDSLEYHGMFNGNAMDFAEFIVPLLSGMKATIHSISNVLIELDGDSAAVETYVWAYHLVPETDGTQTDLIVAGRYLDRFERRNDEWRIAKRTFVLDANQNLKATCLWDSGLYAELKIRGSHDRRDPSYESLDLRNWYAGTV